MDNRYTNEDVCRERLKRQDERFERDRQRLERGEEKIDTLEKAMIYLTENSKHLNESLNDHETRIETLEHRPGAISEKIWLAVASAVISGGVTLVINLIL